MSEYTLVTGDCRDAMAAMQAESVDACVTDPPYHLTDIGRTFQAQAGSVDPHTGRQRSNSRRKSKGFMGKSWDGGDVAFDPATWAAVHRVLKPGARLLAFGAPRTSHRIWCAIEDAGFVLEDTVMWLFGSGFPKHKSKLKPAFEPICVARKGPVSELNIDAGRIGTEHRTQTGMSSLGVMHDDDWEPRDIGARTVSGRWPANVALSHHEECEPVGTRKVRSDGHYPASRGRGGVSTDGHAGQEGLQERHTKGETVEACRCHPDCPVRLLDEQSGELTSGRAAEGGHIRRTQRSEVAAYSNGGGFSRTGSAGHLFGDSGGASRFFYTSKASRAERDLGLEGVEPRPGGSTAKGFTEDVARGLDRNRPVRNHHPTTKPIDLMRWLVRLTTQPGALVLDPFCGSGSTGVACMIEGRRFVGIEIEPEYVEIARRRIPAWRQHVVPRETGEECPETFDLFAEGA